MYKQDKIFFNQSVPSLYFKTNMQT